MYADNVFGQAGLPVFGRLFQLLTGNMLNNYAPPSGDNTAAGCQGGGSSNSLIVTYVNFSGAVLKNCYFNCCDFIGTNFSNVKIKGPVFLLGTNFHAAKSKDLLVKNSFTISKESELNEFFKNLGH